MPLVCLEEGCCEALWRLAPQVSPLLRPWKVRQPSSVGRRNRCARQVAVEIAPQACPLAVGLAKFVRLEGHVRLAEVLRQSANGVLKSRPLQAVAAQDPFDPETSVRDAEGFQQLAFPFILPPPRATAGEVRAGRH